MTKIKEKFCFRLRYIYIRAKANTWGSLRHGSNQKSHQIEILEGLFTCTVSVPASTSVTIKFTLIGRMGSKSNLSVKWSTTIGTMLELWWRQWRARRRYVWTGLHCLYSPIGATACGVMAAGIWTGTVCPFGSCNNTCITCVVTDAASDFKMAVETTCCCVAEDAAADATAAGITAAWVWCIGWALWQYEGKISFNKQCVQNFGEMLWWLSHVISERTCADHTTMVLHKFPEQQFPCTFTIVGPRI